MSRCSLLRTVLLEAAAFWIAVAAVLSGGGCNAPIKQYDIWDETLACDEANRFAYESLSGMKFSITEFDPAEPGRRGTLKGSRAVDGEGKGTQHAVVTIDCKPEGVAVDAREEGKLLGQLELKRGFFFRFVSARNAAEKRAALEEKILDGSAPESLQRGDVRVLLKPVGDRSAKLDFGFYVGGGGVLPLGVRIDNLTKRSYRLDPTEIRLTRTDRKRVGTISPEAAAALIAAARDAETGEPVTSLSRGQIAVRLREKLLTADRLAPGDGAEGFLYFPAGDYKRGRVLLTEEESGEIEGFLVEF